MLSRVVCVTLFLCLWAIAEKIVDANYGREGRALVVGRIIKTGLVLRLVTPPSANAADTRGQRNQAGCM